MKKERFDDMKGVSCNILDMVKKLKNSGWKTKGHHDNWIHRDWIGEFSINDAFSLIGVKGDVDLKTKVFESLGEVSMCWSETPKGVFESSRAEEIGNRLMNDINLEIDSFKNTIKDVFKYSPGKVLVIDTKSIPEEEDFDVEKWMKFVSKQGMQFVQSEPTLKEAINVLQKHLKEDKSEGSYYHSWVCNIAMAFKDEYSRQTKDLGVVEIGYAQDIHKIANQAAKDFLDILIKE